ncbi:MAG: hypothetical protein JWO86_7475 [Myxococcaceae bacterium]|nr:hypothetical protein [Myxococcaceae bacterium]
MKTALSLSTLLLCALIAACSHGSGKSLLGPPPALPEQRRATRFTPLPEWYWEPVYADVHGAPKPVDLPVAEESLVRLEGATRVWDELGADGRERLRRDGIVLDAATEGARPIRVLPPAARLGMGAFYMEMREQRVPYVITLDALAFAVHVAFERALAEVEDLVLGPDLDVFAAELERRLFAEQKGAGVEIGEALRLARGIVAVARGLASEGTLAPPPDLGPVVAQEIARITAHAGPKTSLLLGAPIDYGRFSVPRSAGRPGAFRALAWLATAPLLLVAQSEVPGAVVGVGTSRLHARTAMLLARVSEREFDPAIYTSWSRISRLLAFVWGPSDDLAPGEIAELATALNFTLDDPKHAANVVTVDRLRHRAARGREPLLFDGAGAPGRAGIGMRLFGTHAPPDSVALAALATAHESRLPQALDLAVWIGAPEARAMLHEAGGDGLAGYDAVLSRAVAARPGDDAPARHASVYGSLLDVVMTWLAPVTPATPVTPAAPVTPAEDAPSPAAQRATVESALAAWTYARHDAQPLSRPRPPRVPHAAKELQVTGAPLPAFVEAAPEVIARLVATVGQMRRGLAAIGGLPPTSAAMVTLAEVDDILRVALRVASRGANEEALTSEDTAALASLPARFGRLEDPGDEGAPAMVPLVAELYVDAASDHVVSTATGLVEPAVTVAREPGTGRLVLAIGAHVAHRELVEARGQRSTDASYRARIRGENGRAAPPPAPP